MYIQKLHFIYNIVPACGISFFLHIEKDLRNRKEGGNNLLHSLTEITISFKTVVYVPVQKNLMLGNMAEPLLIDLYLIFHVIWLECPQKTVSDMSNGENWVCICASPFLPRWHSVSSLATVSTCTSCVLC